MSPRLGCEPMTSCVTAKCVSHSVTVNQQMIIELKVNLLIYIGDLKADSKVFLLRDVDPQLPRHHYLPWQPGTRGPICGDDVLLNIGQTIKTESL